MNALEPERGLVGNYPLDAENKSEFSAVFHAVGNEAVGFAFSQAAGEVSEDTPEAIDTTRWGAVQYHLLITTNQAVDAAEISVTPAWLNSNRVDADVTAFDSYTPETVAITQADGSEILDVSPKRFQSQGVGTTFRRLLRLIPKARYCKLRVDLTGVAGAAAPAGATATVLIVAQGLNT